MEIKVSIDPESHVHLLLDYYFYLHHVPDDPTSAYKVVRVFQ